MFNMFHVLYENLYMTIMFYMTMFHVLCDHLGKAVGYEVLLGCRRSGHLSVTNFFPSGASSRPAHETFRYSSPI